MPHSPQRKSAIRRAIELLSKATRDVDRVDTAAMLDARSQFQTLRDELSQTEHPAVVLLASIGERLAGHLHDETRPSTEELHKLTAEIAEHIAKHVGFREETATGNGRTLKLTKQELRLALLDGQRLGELLVKMTMLREDQVAEAVRVQKATGQRLGEALLQLRLLTPEMLESVLRIQKTKRTSPLRDDAWSVHKPPAA